MKDTRTVKIKGEKFEVKKLSIRKFSELMMAIDGLPAKLKGQFTQEELVNFDNMVLISKVPTLVACVTDDMINLMSAASGIDKEILDHEDASLEEFIDLVTVIIELNNVKAIIDKLKNVAKVLQKK